MRLRKRMEKMALVMNVDDKVQRIKKIENALSYAKQLVDDFNAYNQAVENGEKEQDVSYEKNWSDSYNDVASSLKLLITKM
jgi:hypothetical protein